MDLKGCASRPAMFAGGMRAGVTRPAARSPLSHTRKRRGVHAQPHVQTARANSAALTSRTFSDVVSAAAPRSAGPAWSPPRRRPPQGDIGNVCGSQCDCTAAAARAAAAVLVASGSGSGWQSTGLGRRSTRVPSEPPPWQASPQRGQASVLPPERTCEILLVAHPHAHKPANAQTSCGHSHCT
jgi:hypothetical protein